MSQRKVRRKRRGCRSFEWLEILEQLALLFSKMPLVTQLAIVLLAMLLTTMLIIHPTMLNTIIQGIHPLRC
jgi:hypothetical protein